MARPRKKLTDLTVRATVRFQDLQPGDVVVIDASDPHIAKLLNAGWFVPVEPSGARVPIDEE